MDKNVHDDTTQQTAALVRAYAALDAGDPRADKIIGQVAALRGCSSTEAHEWLADQADFVLPDSMAAYEMAKTLFGTVGDFADQPTNEQVARALAQAEELAAYLRSMKQGQ